MAMGVVQHYPVANKRVRVFHGEVVEKRRVGGLAPNFSHIVPCQIIARQEPHVVTLTSESVLAVNRIEPLNESTHHRPSDLRAAILDASDYRTTAHGRTSQAKTEANHTKHRSRDRDRVPVTGSLTFRASCDQPAEPRLLVWTTKSDVLAEGNNVIAIHGQFEIHR